MNEDIPMYALFLNELRGTVSVLMSTYVKSLSGTADATAELQGMYKLFRSVQGSSSILNFTLLRDLSQEAENLISHLLDKKKKVTKDEETALMNTIDVYREISLADEATILATLEQHAKEMEKVRAQLKQLRGSSTYEETLPSSKKTSVLDLIAPTMIRQFCEKIAVVAKKLNRLVIGIENHSYSDVDVIDTIKEIDGMNQAAQDINLPIMMTFAKVLKSSLQQFQYEKMELVSDQIELLLKISDMFKFIGNLPLDSFSSWFIENEKNLDLTILQACQLFEKVMTHHEVKDADESNLKHSLDSTMINLFKIELETQSKVFNEALISLEKQSRDPSVLEPLMRAAHSIKGAARAIRLDQIVHLAHSMEDFFVALQNQAIPLDEVELDIIFKAVDFLFKLSQIPNSYLETWLGEQTNFIEELIKETNSYISSFSSPNGPKPLKRRANAHPVEILEKQANSLQQGKSIEERVLRLSAQNLNRLMGLAGESMVESRWLTPFSEGLIKIKKDLGELSGYFDLLREGLATIPLSETALQYISDIQRRCQDYRHQFADRITELDLFISRHSRLTDRLYTEVIESHMRPFSDGVETFPRMMRDLSKQLNKKVNLKIDGKMTSVDRDILQKLESPLTHMLRNAVDHGIESPEDRIAAGKSAEGTIILEAVHKGGVLSITVSDDGRGINLEALRKKIVDKKLIKPELAGKLSEQELVDFLFLPGFSTSDKVSEISGRGMGLNIVQNLIQDVAGSMRVTNQPGKGLSICLQLPLTLSVIRALILNIQGEPYAFPLARIERVLLVPREEILIIENHQYFSFEGQNIGIIPASQVLELSNANLDSLKTFSIVVLNDHHNYYGLVVDEFLNERELVVQELDARLGKIPNIIAGSFLENGEPVLIMDVEDVVRSIDILLSGGRLQKINFPKEAQVIPKKRVLVVDDSITVREVECRLLRNRGYEVDTAVNGADAWNAVRIGNYDLVVTDVDMPRMNGIELVQAIRNDVRLKSLPVMIVSYKEREADRILGLEAGANYYLTKSSFHDETLINGVVDLIGKA